ncbi:MAG: hypothetical protein A2096_06045 [Spirochaetes bacterium GWF1_41_5]|nr:MAG: hypothetical protein A2096_06045 [Spirochaetes bacterium GWF1_41_5]HBE03057.1 hypothetical protein [Spirochaetia bacterium]
MKKIYFANAVHPNMNYDRSPRSIIREKFPKIYNLFLDYTEARPYIKIHFQLPSQTFNSLKICGEKTLDRIKKLHEKGQARFMGTYIQSLLVCVWTG